LARYAAIDHHGLLPVIWLMLAPPAQVPVYQAKAPVSEYPRR